MNKLIAIIAMLFIVACNTQATITQKVSQIEAGFTSAVSIINDARRPCILRGENDPACFIKADLYITLAPIVHQIDDSLDRAKSFAITNQLDESEKWLDTAKRLLTNIDTYLKPIKAALGLGG